MPTLNTRKRSNRTFETGEAVHHTSLIGQKKKKLVPASSGVRKMSQRDHDVNVKRHPEKEILSEEEHCPEIQMS